MVMRITLLSADMMAGEFMIAVTVKTWEFAAVGKVCYVIFSSNYKNCMKPSTIKRRASSFDEANIIKAGGQRETVSVDFLKSVNHNFQLGKQV